MKQKVLLEFKTHHYFQTYEESDEIYCPNCGGRRVWVESGEGDYYCGPNHICVKCGCHFSIPIMKVPDEDAYNNLTKQLSEGVTMTAKTPKGN